jgi:hypothetical protein
MIMFYTPVKGIFGFLFFIFPIDKEFIKYGHVSWYHLDSTYPFWSHRLRVSNDYRWNSRGNKLIKPQ